MRLWRSLFFIAWSVWLLDLGTKLWAEQVLSSRANVEVIGTFLQLTFIRNPGAAFGIGAGMTIIFTIFAVLVFIFITRYATQITSRGWAVVSGLVLGGVLGNLTDRIFREPGFLQGHVIDWIQLPRWPVFNVADSAIVIAAVIAIILTIRNIAPITPGVKPKDES
jgi:signal peptidase II|uniref:signal peptidase II n=1 Tax=Candidatus Planktophila sp. TaxID=2175601 RepID=UPI004049E005